MTTLANPLVEAARTLAGAVGRMRFQPPVAHVYHPLRYAWSSTGGTLQGTGTSVRLDTASLALGTYTASVRVTDDRNLSADCSASTTVVARPVPP